MYVGPSYVTWLHEYFFEYLAQNHFKFVRNIIPEKVGFMHNLIISRQSYRHNALEGALTLIRLLDSSMGFYTIPAQLCLIYAAS